MGTIGSTGIPWNGNIVEEGEIILHQHAIQNGLTEIQVAMCQWIALIRLNYTRSLDQIILLHTFKHLISLWSDKLLTREELNYLSDSFKVFTEHSLIMICNYNLIFYNAQSDKVLDLNHLLECLCMLHNSRLYQFSSPFSNSLQKEFLTSFKMVVGRSHRETMEMGFVLLGTRHQGVPVIVRELVHPDRFDPVSPSFTARDFALWISCTMG
ncbi:unnamed protein product, partial [Schistosoma mattheei]